MMLWRAGSKIVWFQETGRNRIKNITMMLCCVLLLASCTLAPGGEDPSGVGKSVEIEQSPALEHPAPPLSFEEDDEINELFDCPIDIYGTWKIVYLFPDELLIAGSLHAYKHKIMGLYSLGKEVEYHPDYYRFDQTYFNDIEYHFDTVLPREQAEDGFAYESSEYINLLNRINQENHSDDPLPMITDEDVVIDYLYFISISGAYEEIESSEFDEDKMDAEIMMSFVVINEDYIYSTVSGVLCQRVK